MRVFPGDPGLSLAGAANLVKVELQSGNLVRRPISVWYYTLMCTGALECANIPA